jgi:hypothetical protein
LGFLDKDLMGRSDRREALKKKEHNKDNPYFGFRAKRLSTQLGNLKRK